MWLIVLVAVAVVGVTYWVGMEVEKSYRAALRDASLHPGVGLTEVSYSRGILSSEAVTRVTPVGGDASAAFTLKHQIHHGKSSG